ncbi:hypothetical protein MMC14_006837 [Varicellaria rhodocarpa]|nr:hypothetical protein [Varicellaria rhodocarpa]
MPSKSSMAENDHERFTTPTGQQTESTREIDQVVKEHPTLENYLKFMIYIGKELNAHHRTAHIVRYLNTTPRLIKANSPLSFEAQDYARGLYDTILKGPHQERIRYKNIWNEKCSVKYQDMVFAGLNKAKQEEEKGDEIIVRDKDEEDDQDWKTKEEEQLDGWLMDNDIKEHDRNAAAKERGPVENPTEHSGEARIQVENQTEVDSGEARSESKEAARATRKDVVEAIGKDPATAIVKDAAEATGRDAGRAIVKDAEKHQGTTHRKVR